MQALQGLDKFYEEHLRIILCIQRNAHYAPIDSTLHF